MTTDTREALAARLRMRGNDLRSHPIANSTIDCVEEAGDLLIEAADALATQPAQPSAQGEAEDMVLVSRGLIGAACAAIRHKRDAPKTLEELRRYTVGDRSAPAAQPSAQGEAVALPQDVLDFLREVATQPKSKPDYWSSCGQCESNQSKAEDLLASAPAAPAQAVPLTTEQVQDLAKYAGLDWQRGYIVDDIHNRYEDFARAIEAHHGIKAAP